MTSKVQSGNEARRRAIVSAARVAFLRNGYGNTSMSAIAAKLGGSKTTLWSYFRNKRELFDAVVDDMIERYGEALRVPLPPDGDARETLHTFAVSIITTITRPQIMALHRMVTGEAGRFPELGQAMVERGMKRGQARLAGWIGEQMARGTFRAGDPLMAATHFGGLCQSGVFQHYLLGASARPDSAQIEIEAAAATDFFLRGYAPS